MVKTHLFVTNFFADMDWLTMYTNNYYAWGDLYELTMVGRGEFKCQIRLRIEKKRFYILYHSYVKQFYSSSKPRDNGTFDTQCEDAGVIIHNGKNNRRVLNGKKKTCVDLYFSRCEAALCKLYPELQFEWEHQTDFKKVCECLAKTQTYELNEQGGARTEAH